MSELRDNLMAALMALAAGAGLTAREVADVVAPLGKTDALAAALEHRAGVLLLLGKPGTGKTVAAIRWLLRPLLELGNWVHDNGRWYPRRQFSGSFRTAKSLARVRQYEQRDLEALFEVRRLVVDDMGQEFLDKSGFLASLIDEVVTERHRRNRATVMTANLSVDLFLERYGDRVLDRVNGDGRVVICEGDSLRVSAIEPGVPHAITVREVSARARACAEEQLRDAEGRHAAWLESERGRQAALAAAAPAPPPPAPMTPEELAARRREIAAQLEEWTKRNEEKA